MGNSYGVDIYITNESKLDKIEGSDLYNSLLAIPGNTPDRIIIPLKPFGREVGMVLGGNYSSFYSKLMYKDKNLIVSLDKNTVLLILEYGITYDLSDIIGPIAHSTDIVCIQTLIERFIEKEIAAYKILSKYSELKSTKIYQCCKYILIQGIDNCGFIRIENRQDENDNIKSKVVYGYHDESIEIEVPDLPEYSHLNMSYCTVSTCGYILLTEQEMEDIKNKSYKSLDIDLELGYGYEYRGSDIAEAILSKVVNREYNIPKLLDNMAVNRTKRARNF